jgi:Uma2 family endonuclease
MFAPEPTLQTLEVREEPRILRHRITVDDYYRMAEVGLLAHDARVELIEGEIIEMASIGSRHYAAVAKLSRLLERAVLDQAIVVAQSSLRLSRSSQPEPDLVLIKPRADFYATALPTGADSFLVVEVSDTTLPYDVKVKAPLYAQHGVPEYWVIDIEQKALRRFAAPQDGSWTDVTVVVSPGVVCLPGVEGATIDLSGLF